MGRAGRTGFVVATLAALLAAAPAALAAGTGAPPSRAEFVDEADSICEVPYRKGLRLLGNADERADAGDYVPAGKKVVRAGRTFLGVNERLSNLVTPTADTRLIEAWLKGVREGSRLVVKAGKAYKRKRPKGAERLLDRSHRTTRRANKKVAALGFNFCA